VLVSLFLTLLLAAWLGAISSTLHWLMMLHGHLLLMVLSIHLWLMMHHLLIPMLSVRSVNVLGSFVHVGLVSPTGVIVAVNIFSLVVVPVVLGLMFLTVFFTAHSCSLAVTFIHVPGPVFSFSCSSFASRSNAFSNFAMLRAFGPVE
jgi:hypothetical protein